MFNVYGPGQDSKNNFLGMISIFLNMAKKTSEIKVKGSLKDSEILFTSMMF